MDRVAPERKLYCGPPRLGAGGGGINVSRAIRKLGGTSLAAYAQAARSAREAGATMIVDSSGDPLREAAGTAAVMTEGSGICRREDAERLFAFMNEYQPE